jgi:hypothetical protein
VPLPAPAPLEVVWNSLGLLTALHPKPATTMSEKSAVARMADLLERMEARA